MKIIVIYKITINDEYYIGSTGDFHNRVRQHKHNLTNIKGDKYNLPLYKYIRDNGGFEECKWDIVDLKCCESGSLSVQKELEQSIIQKLKPTLNVHSAFQPYKNKKEYDKIRWEKRKYEKQIALQLEQYAKEHPEADIGKFN